VDSASRHVSVSSVRNLTSDTLDDEIKKQEHLSRYRKYKTLQCDQRSSSTVGGIVKARDEKPDIETHMSSPCLHHSVGPTETNIGLRSLEKVPKCYKAVRIKPTVIADSRRPLAKPLAILLRIITES